jgi:hypothetical protein
MSDSFEQQEWVKFGVAAELAKQYAADQKLFLDLFAKTMEAALPGQTEIGRQGGLFSKKTIQRVTVTLGENRYSLEDTGRGLLRATRTHIVRGIALKTEETPVEDWIRDLGEALDAQAQTSAAAREALARHLGTF